ncbi:MAG: ribose 5-phosphate isomerase B [Sphingomonas sp.]|nr:ribose 5-phosphate isomerase B [Sphingomonas sp.]MBW0008245.1 ribose 5-phosphate isomerase B [Sphingomonas sp.]
MRIAVSADHAGVDLKDLIAGWLREQGHDVLDLGTNSHESVDYPKYGVMLADALADGRAERGITVCGSGIGVAIAANRNPACRCAQVSEPVSATLSRKHNDANAIALGARLIGPEMAIACVQAFLETDFEGGRHQRRVDQLSQLLQETH